MKHQRMSGTKISKSMDIIPADCEISVKDKSSLEEVKQLERRQRSLDVHVVGHRLPGLQKHDTDAAASSKKEF